MKRMYSIIMGLIAALVSSTVHAASMIDSTALTAMQTDAIADVTTVGTAVLAIMMALLGLFFAIRTLRKGGA